MKTTPSLLIAVAAVLGVSPLLAQEAPPRPENPPAPSEPRERGERPQNRAPGAPERNNPGDARPRIQNSPRPAGELRAQGRDSRNPQPGQSAPFGQMPQPGMTPQNPQQMEQMMRMQQAQQMQMQQMQEMMKRSQRPTPILGVITHPVPPELAVHLKMPEGFGLVVGETLPDSPARAAGIERNDVLRLFNDQQLVNPEQLATLTRAAGKDNEVTLTIIHQGAEKKVTVRPVEKMMPQPMRNATERAVGQPGRVQELLRERWENGPRFSPKDGAPGAGQQNPEAAKELRERLQRYRSFVEEWAKKPDNRPFPEPPKMDLPEDRPGSETPAPVKRLRERLRRHFEELREWSKNPGDRPLPSAPEIGMEDGARGATGPSLWTRNQARVMRKDDAGEYELNAENGRRSFTARKTDGSERWTGPVDTEEQRAAIPAELREKFEQLSQAPLPPVETQADNVEDALAAGAVQ